MSDFFQKWDKILSWEVANHPLKMLEKKDLLDLSLADLEQELDKRAKDYHEHRYSGR